MARPRKDTEKRRSPGDGSVYYEDRNGERILVASRTKTYWIGGKSVKKTIRRRGFKDKTEARKWLAKQIDELDKWAKQENERLDPSLLNEKNLTTKRLWAEYIKPEAHAYCDLSPNTQKNYLLYYNKCESIYDALWNELRTMDFQKVIDATSETYAPRKKCRTVLSAMGTFAIAHGWARDNQVQRCKLPTCATKDKEIYTAEDIKTLWSYYNGEIPFPPITHRNGKYISDEDKKSTVAAILIMIYSGVRPGELFNIRREYVDMEAREIKNAGIKTPTGKRRTIFFTTHVKDLIDLYIMRDGNIYAQFANDDATFRERVKSITRELGIGERLPSACRTTSASHLASIGTPAEELRRILGHSDISVTRRYYDKSNDDRAKSALDRIDEAIDIAPEQRIESYKRQIEELQRKIEAEQQKQKK